MASLTTSSRSGRGQTSSSGALSSSVHVSITALLGIVVTALSCFAFYVFRMLSTREESFTNALKVIRSATEIVSTLAERGIPTLRGRVDNLESQGRVLEQTLRRTAVDIARVTSSPSTSAVAAAIAAPIESEEAMLAARRAARLGKSVA